MNPLPHIKYNMIQFSIFCHHIGLSATSPSNSQHENNTKPESRLLPLSIVLVYQFTSCYYIFLTRLVLPKLIQTIFVNDHINDKILLSPHYAMLDIQCTTTMNLFY